jgi:DNA-binding CsgD family transcriptional regulator
VNFSARQGTETTFSKVCASADFFEGFCAFFDRFGGDADRDGLIRLVQEAATRLGADAAYYLSIVREARAALSYRFLLACDPLWCFEYEAVGGQADDPWLLYAMAHAEPICASAIPIEGERQRLVRSLADRYGFRSAVVLPTTGASALARQGLLVFGSRYGGFFEDECFSTLRLLGRSLAIEVHEMYGRLLRREGMQRLALTKLDLELLARESHGQTTKVIAREIGLTPVAVDMRFFKVNAKLGASNRQAAVRIAVELGLV